MHIAFRCFSPLFFCCGGLRKRWLLEPGEPAPRAAGPSEPRRGAEGSAEPHTPTCFWRSAASGVQRGRCRCQETGLPHPTTSLPLSPSQPQVSLPHQGRLQQQAEGGGGGADSPALKHRNCFLAIALPPRINFSFFLSSEAQPGFYLLGVCGDETSFVLILHTANAPS